MTVRYACMPREKIEEGGLWVAAVQPDDIEFIRQWRNGQIDVLRQKAPITPDQQRAYYAREIWPSLDSPEPANILLAYHEGQQLIGYGGLVHIAWEHRRAEVSILLDPVLMTGPEIYGPYFLTFLRLMKKLAFEDLSFERLTTETFAIRTDIIRLLEAAGFRHEGTLRRHVFIDGKAVDSLVHGCLRDEQP